MLRLSSYIVLPLVQALLAVVLAVVVLAARRHNRSHVPFGLFLLGIGGWGGLIFLMRTAASPSAALPWERWLVPLALLLAALLLHFATLWTRPGRCTALTVIAYVQIVAGLASVLGPQVIEDMRRTGHGYTPVAGPLFPLWSAACLWPLGVGVARLVRLARTTREVEERNRLAYMLVGMVLAFIGGILDLLPILGLPGSPGLVVGILAFCALATLAILRHDLLDIQAALRSTLAALSASVIVAVPLLGSAVLVSLAQRDADTTGRTALLAAAVVVAVGAPALWQPLRRWVDRRLLGRRWDHLEAIEKLIQEIQPLSDVPHIGRILVDRLERFFGAQAVSLLTPRDGTGDMVLAASTLPDPGSVRLPAGRVLVRWLPQAPPVVSFRRLEEIPQVQRAMDLERHPLEALRAELLVPLRQRGRGLVGLLVLGPRARSRPYGVEDRRLLSTLASPLAAVLDNERRYADALRSRGDLERWLNGMSDGVLIVGADGRARFVNAAARTRLALHEGDDCGSILGPAAGSSAGTGLQGFEFTHGDVRWEASAAPLADPGGTTSRIVVVRDQTERQRREQELLRAQRLESLGVLAGGIAHDFNNILTAILGNLELAAREAGQRGELRDLLDAAAAACGRARKLTGQLLTFSRGGAPVTRALDIGRLLRETVSFAAAGSAVRTELRIADGLWPVMADEGQLGQVISNLVINAVQAMARGGTLRVEAVNEPVGEESSVRLSVADEGIGIPAENLDRIFDPWFTTKASGSGLGLAVVHEVIRRHRGRVQVSSTPGTGTVFTVWLPAAPQEVPKGGEGAPAAELKGGRILVMDDEAAVRAVTGAMLARLGCTVTLAVDGAEAIRLHADALAEGRPFDAVLLDLTVPGGMGGVDAARVLLAAQPGVRLVATSGYSSDDTAARHRELGFSAFLAKPFTVGDLDRALAALAGDPLRARDPGARTPGTETGR